MTALPLSIVGAMVGLLITGNDFTIMSFIGLVGLTGIVVNDSIVLVDCINRMRKSGMNIYDAIVAGGQQRLRPIISTTLSTMGGIFTLTIIDKLWEGLGVVIIFGIGFATVLTLVVVPVMYSLFEGFSAYMIAAFRGTGLKEAPEGKGFYFSRRRFARFKLLFILLIQACILLGGAYYFYPKLIMLLESAVFRAPSAVKLGIEILVFYLALGGQAAGVLFLLLFPLWVGLAYLMGLRSTEERYVDVTPEKLTLIMNIEKIIVNFSDITKVSYSSLLKQITLKVGARKIRIRKVVQTQKTPGKIPLKTWLAAPATSRADIRKSMLDLRHTIESLSTKAVPSS